MAQGEAPTRDPQAIQLWLGRLRAAHDDLAATESRASMQAPGGLAWGYLVGALAFLPMLIALVFILNGLFGVGRDDLWGIKAPVPLAASLAIASAFPRCRSQEQRTRTPSR